jgi:splicing factor 3B subunit 4
MRSSDTPLPQHTAVSGRSAGYGISQNHSYDTHTQGEENYDHFGMQNI